MTGDIADAAGQDETVCTLSLALSSIAPTYYVTGNHEWADVNMKRCSPLSKNAE
jgi:predicted MPP superfamily phosphohydrolase